MFKHIARILLGITFIFSGFVKGIDPLGSTYKFTDYFNAFHMPWMIGLAFHLVFCCGCRICNGSCSGF